MKKIQNLFGSKKNEAISFGLIAIAYIVVEILLKTGNISSLFKNLLVPCCCYIVAALALNLCVGFSGELSLGHAGFMSIGAFTAVIVSGLLENIITFSILRLVIAMICGFLMAGLLGFLISIPVLKLEGDYLAIVTLAFCQIIASIINNIYLGFDENGLQFSFIEDKLDLAKGGKTLLGGPIGASGTDRISSFTAGILLIALTLFIIYNLLSSKNGRAIMASRDNRIAALSVGIDVVKTKTLAFVLSAAIAGAAGALYGLNFSSLAATKFNFNQSILILVYVVLGGLGNINGTIIATVLLYVLPEMLRSLEDYRMIIYSLVLIAIMLISNNQFLKEKKDQLLDKLKKKEVRQ